MKNKINNLDEHDIFVCGLIGSGKDSIVNAIMKKYDYSHHKIRIAGNIKGVIQDIYGFNNEELEHQKRKSPDIRKMHHEVSDWMDKYPIKVDGAGFYGTFNNKFQMDEPKIKSDNRAVLIAKHHSIEFENPIKNFIVPDVRSYNEIKIMFENNPNVIGIFMLRSVVTTEFVDDTHWTNKLDYTNKNLINLLNIYKDRVILVNNTTHKSGTVDKFGELGYESNLSTVENLNLGIKW